MNILILVMMTLAGPALLWAFQPFDERQPGSASHTPLDEVENGSHRALTQQEINKHKQHTASVQADPVPAGDTGHDRPVYFTPDKSNSLLSKPILEVLITPVSDSYMEVQNFELHVWYENVVNEPRDLLVFPEALFSLNVQRNNDGTWSLTNNDGEIHEQANQIEVRSIDQVNTLVVRIPSSFINQSPDKHIRNIVINTYRGPRILNPNINEIKSRYFVRPAGEEQGQEASFPMGLQRPIANLINPSFTVRRESSNTIRDQLTAYIKNSTFDETPIGNVATLFNQEIDRHGGNPEIRARLTRVYVDLKSKALYRNLDFEPPELNR